MEGDGMAVAINKHHNKDPSTEVPSVCYIDGDSKQQESSNERVFRLPGQSPEAHVFDFTLEKWNEIGGKLSVALLQRYENSQLVQQTCRDVRRTNRDPHLLFAQVGERLGLVPESTVAAAFANIWAQAYPDSVNEVLAPIRNDLPREKEVRAEEKADS